MYVCWSPGEWELVNVFLDVGKVWGESKDECTT